MKTKRRRSELYFFHLDRVRDAVEAAAALVSGSCAGDMPGQMEDLTRRMKPKEAMGMRYQIEDPGAGGKADLDFEAYRPNLRDEIVGILVAGPASVVEAIVARWSELERQFRDAERSKPRDPEPVRAAVTPSADAASDLRREAIPIERQLEELGRCGIALSPGTTLDDLLGTCPREELEAESYVGLLLAMAGVPEAPTDEWKSKNVLHLDLECAPGEEEIERVVAAMATLAGGALPLEGVKATIDEEKGHGRLIFRTGGRERRIAFETDGDWLDPVLLEGLDDALRRTGTNRAFIHIDLGGQDCLIACGTAKELESLRKVCGLPASWLGAR